MKLGSRTTVEDIRHFLNLSAALVLGMDILTNLDVLSFGLHSAPSTFQRLIDRIIESDMDLCLRGAFDKPPNGIPSPESRHIANKSRKISPLPLKSEIHRPCCHRYWHPYRFL